MALFKLNGDNLHDTLNKLFQEGRIPQLARDEVEQVRWQEKPHPSAVFYGVPTTNLGRFNDPSFKAGICYTADNACIAVAESYGRKREADPSNFFIGDDSLHIAQLCTLKTTRQTVTVNLSRLLPLLHLTADKVMGPDYSITQSITEWAANTPGLPFDGITYQSRHLNDKTCTAWWVRKGADDPLSTSDMTSVAEYCSADQSNFPEFWTDENIYGKEILLFSMNYEISSNNS
ncbi:RES domain-containing protein [Pantoea sp. SORGH_AS_0659]|uniref:RES domain-containing protein n=1 Tax=Pantoea sp. SORGH_AS_0659 TaxID=3062597 RepID=UPI002854D6FD|nr:RES domain-containing protein [Pantoea sp. SORGH_AS_0659]MDR6352539.1 hypothetical protein [Pantoea sp. SORGH_AS_0659]